MLSRSSRCAACLALGALMLLACGPSGPGKAVVKEGGDPQIERIADPDATAAAEATPMLLVCGYNKVLEQPLDVVTYYDAPPQGLSLYEFHVEDHLTTWLTLHPQDRGYALRIPVDGAQREAIGRAVSEPCFGNGELAADVIRQVVVHRAGGRTPTEALHNLLRQDRTTHFLIDRDGTVYQPLDVVHAAYGPTENTNFAIYVALIAPRRPSEWLPEVLLPATFASAAGITAAPIAAVEPPAGVTTPIPADAQASRVACTVNGRSVQADTYTDAQRQALATLTRALADEYPAIQLETPVDSQGVLPSNVIEDSPYHTGVLADHHTDASLTDLGCFELDKVVSP